MSQHDDIDGPEQEAASLEELKKRLAELAGPDRKKQFALVEKLSAKLKSEIKQAPDETPKPATEKLNKHPEKQKEVLELSKEFKERIIGQLKRIQDSVEKLNDFWMKIRPNDKKFLTIVDASKKDFDTIEKQLNGQFSLSEQQISKEQAQDPKAAEKLIQESLNRACFVFANQAIPHLDKELLPALQSAELHLLITNSLDSCGLEEVFPVKDSEFMAIEHNVVENQASGNSAGHPKVLSVRSRGLRIKGTELADGLKMKADVVIEM